MEFQEILQQLTEYADQQPLVSSHSHRIPKEELKELSSEYEVSDIIHIQVNKKLGQRHLIKLIKRK